jgi:inosine/xanthosine triphosphate pyrophosphatase family protein
MAKRKPNIKKLLQQMGQKKKRKAPQKTARVVALEGKKFFRRGGRV